MAQKALANGQDALLCLFVVLFLPHSALVSVGKYVSDRTQGSIVAPVQTY